ncbi:peptidoglycan D,D-transpeptidase FtsI family protein [Dictyobacter arantiisoli]|uniref:Cell division protein FtsI n=1 Tax=Dictyobacter arantiisoli TaxID=2014874 RepID=A0A5A5TK35_9CHLR|nr:penicillin-binding transpeptidase domain-containing protein [Dictyobacter arantiisoli]GCF11436.1 cell division protein FtsI [Dictyobacter arantiisoli]
MHISSSIRKLNYLFVILFIALSGGLVYWQVIQSDNVTSTIHNPRRCLADNTPQRGRIFDRNGVLLAESVPDQNVCGGYIRKYTESSLANIIGYYVPGYYTPGIEGQYNDVLNGANGRTALGNEINKVLHQALVGNDIYLTIDVRIQRLAVQEFNDYHPETDPFYFQIYSKNLNAPSNRGSVVISDPQTGEMLAMVSSPGYDPNRMVQTLTHNDLSYYNQMNQDPTHPLLNRPLQETYVPGSIFKTVTLMAALDAGTTTLDHPWDKKGAMGPLVYDGRQIFGDNLGYGEFVFHFPISTEFAYANSDNIVFAQIGVSLGLNSWLDYAKKMYLGQTIPFDLPVAKSSVENSDGTPLSTLQLASNAYGQGVDSVTPLQMSLIDNTVANNGVMMRPMLLSKVTDNNNNLLQTYTPQQLNTVISKDAAFQVRKALSAVTTCGSGWHLGQNFGYQSSIAGKTGTAQLGGTQVAHGWMITQAPFTLQTTDEDQMPNLSIVAMRENGGEGAYAVGPAIWKMYNDIFAKGYVKAQLPTPLTSDPYCLNTGLWQTR